jgi:gamma-glutamyltranspeptidase/glutathione hydrolase
MDVPPTQLLDREYLRRRAREVGDRADERTAGGPPADGDTIYLCAADRDGNVVSLIQSLFSAWGSGVLVPGTGVTLHNRGFSFRLVEGHVNALAPGKRPMHTLIPGFAMRDDKPWFAFGTRGADGQPQTGLQVVTNMLDFGLDPQAALEEPRWVHGAPDARYPRTAVVLESRYGPGVAEDLRSRGHEVVVAEPLAFVTGTVQVIQVDHERGCYIGASDPRGDGVALAV